MPRHRGRTALVTGLAAMAAAAALAGYLINRDTSGPGASPDALATQMEAALHGAAPSLNVYGGPLMVDQGSVTAAGIPPGACVSVGWQLVRKGLLSVNGVMPSRVSAAKLSELCNLYDIATISWTPKQAD
jgi:hypothetical protein